MKKIFIIILNFNGKADTIACLETLQELRIMNSSAGEAGYELRIVVVDNGSTDGSVEAIRHKLPQTLVLENKSNLGFAEGNNVGIRYALENGADYVVLLNNDTLVDKNFVEELLKGMKSDLKIGVVSPKIYFAPGFEFHRDRYKESEKGKVIWYAGGKIDWQNVLASHNGVDEVDHGQHNKQTETDFATGCCMLIKKEVFLSIGLLDTKYFLYWEDTDFCQRAKRAGFKVVYIPGSVVWHKNAGSGGGSGSQLQDYYTTRNRLFLGMRYAPLRSKIALLRESLFKIFAGRQWQRRGILDFYLQRFGRGSYPFD